MRNVLQQAAYACLMLACLARPVVAGGGKGADVKTAYERRAETAALVKSSDGLLDFSSRKSLSILYSAFIPGAGQTYLGNELKGAAISVGFFGAGTAFILAHNNSASRQNRIDALFVDYKAAGTFAAADKIYTEIDAEKARRDYDNKRRTIYMAATIGVWLYNMFDILYISEDQGADQFSAAPGYLPELSVTAGSGGYNGIALKFILP